jgi:CBS domain-containing protein
MWRRNWAGGPATARRQDITTLALSDLMTRGPLTCAPDTPLIEAARRMRELGVSCIIATDGGAVRGILTTGDITARAVAEGRPPETPVHVVMTPDPLTLPPTALVADVLHAMVERGITHMPVVEAGRLVGILTQTDLTRFQATSSAALIREITAAPDSATLARIVARIPEFLAQLVGAQNQHQTVTRLITDIGDATTRRLLALAEARLGPPPVPYLWLACGSQGRQEQTGISDQDNCLILDDAVTPPDDAYFAALSKFVSDGLNEAGYFYCPGDMMATNIKWRQPLRVWRDYFRRWIAVPNPEAQMLASVMFDLRPIGGRDALFAHLQEETLAAAAQNSIFVAHMVSNSLKHHTPLGLFRGFATVRSGEHKNTIDLKLNGVVPVVDLGRIYALKGQLTVANTRARLLAAIEVGAGLILGLSLRLLVFALQVAGTIAAQAASLSQLFGGAAIDPLPTVGHILTITGLAVAASQGLHVDLAAALIDTYRLFPPGGTIDAGEIGLWSVQRTSSAIALAFSLALPFVMAATVYNLALGVLNRAMPQFMATFIGVPALTWAVLVLLFLSTPLIIAVWIDTLFGLLASGGVMLP